MTGQPPHSVHLDSIANYGEDLLNVLKIPDIALNGIQIGTTKPIVKLAAAVDFSQATAKAAKAAGANLLLVHHGFFWGKVQPINGRIYELVKRMLDQDMALLAYHLPLDLHADFGNNALLAKLFNLELKEVKKNSKSQVILTQGDMPGKEGMSWGDFLATVKSGVGTPLSTLIPHTEPVRRLGIVSGRGSGYVEEAFQNGCDTFLTGDADHTLFHLAQELGIRIVSAGHYATETFGVKAFGEHLSQKFQLPFTFIDIPTAL